MYQKQYEDLHNKLIPNDDQVADQFHDLAPYASTDILRNQIPPLYQVSHS